MHIAVEGCSHGCLTDIYSTIEKAEKEKSIKVDLLLLCGDFQALRNSCDYDSIAIPPKFRSLGSFHEYYSGARKAPCLTIVIGGNHECMAYMWELYHGGWLAPNIYYLGHAGSVLVNGLRISGASGIYKSHDYHKGHYEKVPYDRSTVRSAYHTRSYDIHRLSQLKPRSSPEENPDIFLSHDWPIGITRFGDERSLLRKKAFFTEEVQTNTLGSPPLLKLLQTIHPAYWFAAHLHVKFSALVPYADLKELEGTMKREIRDKQSTGQRKQEVKNPDEIVMDDMDSDADEEPAPAVTVTNPDEVVMDDMDDSSSESSPLKSEEVAGAPIESVDRIEASGSRNVLASVKADDEGVKEVLGEVTQEDDTALQKQGIETRFLALDKCGPNRQFIQFLDIPTPESDSPPKLEFDPEWLAITRAFHPWLSLSPNQRPLPNQEEGRRLIDEAREWIQANVVEREMPEVEVPIELAPSADVEPGPEVESKPEDEEMREPESETSTNAPTTTRRIQYKPLEVDGVQVFAPTAPSELEGLAMPGQWFTNRQTEEFCKLIGVENVVNPIPKA